MHHLRMLITNAIYKGSFPTLDKCPEPVLPEFAFIGRSNVGKSSLINMLTCKKGLAHTSKKPGKTEAINFYLLNGNWYMVDLPGYGYALRSKDLVRSFSKMIEDYLRLRPALFCAFVLIDANVEPQEKDVEFVNWLGEHQVPFVLAFTKADKMKPRQQRENIERITARLLQTWEVLPDTFVTSSVTNQGREEILDFIEALIRQVAES